VKYLVSSILIIEIISILTRKSRLVFAKGELMMSPIYHQAFCSRSQGALRDQDKVDIAKKTRSYSTNLTDNSVYVDRTGGEEPMRTKIATLNCINRL